MFLPWKNERKKIVSREVFCRLGLSQHLAAFSKAQRALKPYYFSLCHILKPTRTFPFTSFGKAVVLLTNLGTHILKHILQIAGIGNERLDNTLIPL